MFRNLRCLTAAAALTIAPAVSHAAPQAGPDEGADDAPAQPTQPAPTQAPPPPPSAVAPPTAAQQNAAQSAAPPPVQQPAPRVQTGPAQPPPPAQPAPQVAQPAPAQPASTGQWVYTQQYGWLWMPYGQSYTYVTPGSSAAYMYVYGPSLGWRWVVAPWVFGWGPRPYWGAWGPRYYAWHARPWFRAPVRRVYRGPPGYRHGYHRHW